MYICILIYTISRMARLSITSPPAKVLGAPNKQKRNEQTHNKIDDTTTQTTKRNRNEANKQIINNKQTNETNQKR